MSDPVFTHAVHNYFEDVILNRIHQLGFNNEKDDKVKVFYIPCYLNGDDGLLNRTYYNMLAGLDLTVYPSYYEPWGYTPMESCAFGVPTITTSLSGFGMWCKSIGRGKDIQEGVAVVNRTDSNYETVVSSISDIIFDCASTSMAEAKPARQEAKKIAARAAWKNFIKYYDVAFDEALKNTARRIKN